MRDIVWSTWARVKGFSSCQSNTRQTAPRGSDTGSTIAWWETEGGAFLAAAAVGAG